MIANRKWREAELDSRIIREDSNDRKYKSGAPRRSRRHGLPLSPFAPREEFISRSEMSTNKTTLLTIENVLISLREMIFREAKGDNGYASASPITSPRTPVNRWFIPAWK
jgi:hypothetical protein